MSITDLSNTVVSQLLVFSNAMDYTVRAFANRFYFIQLATRFSKTRQNGLQNNWLPKVPNAKLVEITQRQK